jgi:hypothetical protein
MFGCLPFVSVGHHSDGVLHNYYTKMMPHTFPGEAVWWASVWGGEQKKFDRSGFRR